MGLPGFFGGCPRGRLNSEHTNRYARLNWDEWMNIELNSEEGGNLTSTYQSQKRWVGALPADG